MEEYFDIVDENNKPLGIIKSREETHKDLAYWHRVTHVWVVNDKKEILCQQRSFNKDASPGKWQSFFGGHLKMGETYQENAVNEMREELGLKVNTMDLTPIYVRKSQSAKHFAQVYLINISKDQDFDFDDKEVEKVQWFTVDGLKQAIRGGAFCNSMDDMIEEWLMSKKT